MRKFHLSLLLILGIFPEDFAAAESSLPPIPPLYSALPLNVEDLSLLLKPVIAEYDIPGMVAAVISSDNVLGVGAAGIRLRGCANKVTIHDEFHIGSDAKSMTATVLARLVEKGVLQWDTKVIDVFPALKGKIDPSYNTLTLEQLLTHRGGVVANIDFDKIQKAANNDLVKARQRAMEQALAAPSTVAPGAILYSNVGYTIAGHMAEKVTGRPWEDLIREMLFFPLGMQSAGFGPPGNPQTCNQPVGHQENGASVAKGVYGDNAAMMSPAGTVHLSILDWAKYVMIHLRAARKNPTLLKLNTFKKLQTPISNPPPAYAMGWIVEEAEWAQGEVLSHAGSNTLWYAKVWIAPKRNLAILVACNEGGAKAEAACDKAGLALMQSQLHEPAVKAL